MMIEAKRYPRSVLDMNPSQDVLMVSDRAGLVGLIRRLHAHGIVLISVRQVLE